MVRKTGWDRLQKEEWGRVHTIDWTKGVCMNKKLKLLKDRKLALFGRSGGSVMFSMIGVLV